MKELISIQAELKAPKNQFNKFGGYKYRSCEDILEALKALLLKYKCYLTIQDEIVVVEGGWHYVKATATITNEAGESVSTSAYAREEESKKGMDGAQITGSSSSYARKYALNGLFCIDDTKDSDATNTHGKEEKATPASQPQPKQTAPQQQLTPSGNGKPAPAPGVRNEQTGGQAMPVLIDQVIAEINSAKDGKELTAIYKKYKASFQGEENERFINAIKQSPVNPNRKQ